MPFRNIFMVIVIFATAFTISPANASRIDLTQALLAQPEVVQGIHSICKKICIGNERKSWLTQATFDIIDTDTYSILEIHVRLRNRERRKIFGKQVTFFSDHSSLQAKIRIHNETCEASIREYKKDIHFTNDLYKITWWLALELDKLFDFLPPIKAHLPNCA